MVRLLQARGVVAIGCLRSRESLKVGILILDEPGEAPRSGAADLVDRDDPSAPTTMVFLPNPPKPGVYFFQSLELCPF